MPVLVAQGLSDKLVRPSATAAFVDEQKQRGTAVVYDPIPGATHGTVADKALPAVLQFFDRLDGSSS